MALIKCPECGRERVSDSALACPECGFGVRDYVEEERKKTEEEIRAKEKADRQLEENKKKLKELSNKAQLEIKKINESTPPEKVRLKIDFEDGLFVWIVILLILAITFFVAFFHKSEMIIMFLVCALVESYLVYKYYKRESELIEEIAKDWDKIKLEKIENLKKEYENKAK